MSLNARVQIAQAKKLPTMSSGLPMMEDTVKENASLDSRCHTLDASKIQSALTVKNLKERLFAAIASAQRLTMNVMSALRETMLEFVLRSLNSKHISLMLSSKIKKQCVNLSVITLYHKDTEKSLGTVATVA